MAGEKILIVDDEEATLKLLRIELLTEGYQVITAKTGREAVQKARMITPDLILMDVILPDMTGGEVAQALQSDPLSRYKPILFLTALFSKQEEQNRTMLNVNHQQYLTLAKPFTAEDLLTQVKKALGKK